MKISLLRWPATGCSTDVYCSKQTGSSSTKGNHHPSFLRFWNWAEETVDAAKICGGAENVVKTENPANIRKWIARFIIFRHLCICWKRVCIAHNNCMSCPSDSGQLYLHCSLIYFWVPSSCFTVISLSLEGEIIPFSGVCQSGEAALSTPEAVVASRTD